MVMREMATRIGTKRRCTEQNKKQSAAQASINCGNRTPPSSARRPICRFQLTVEAMSKSQHQQRLGEQLAQRVADVIANARNEGITYTELPPQSIGDLANIERALQPTLNAYYAYIQTAAPPTDVFQSYASRWRCIRD